MKSKEESKQDTVGKQFYEAADMTITIMKTQEQIEQLAEFKYQRFTNQATQNHFKLGFQDGYIQCQEDMLIVLRSEIKRAYQYGQTNAQMMEVGIERDEIEEYVSFRMLSFKKK